MRSSRRECDMLRQRCGARGRADRAAFDRRSACSRCTCSLLGVPAISLPVLQDDGLPLGLQVTGFAHGDAAVFARRRPSIDNHCLRAAASPRPGHRSLPMKLAVPDMISNSYFPAIAAIELGFFKQEGLDVELELIFPVDKCYAALRDGAVDFVGGSAHSALAAFPEWQGVKLLCAQAQGMYWFLVMHKDFGATRGDLGVVKGKSIGAAPWVEMGLRRLLDRGRHRSRARRHHDRAGAGRDRRRRQFRRHRRARRWRTRKIDGFWANGMGAEVAVQARRRHRRARRAPRRRTEALLQLHDGVDRHDRRADRSAHRIRPPARCGRSSRRRPR